VARNYTAPCRCVFTPTDLRLKSFNDNRRKPIAHDPNGDIRREARDWPIDYPASSGRLQILVWQMPSLYRRNAFRQTALKQKRGEFYDDVLLFTSGSS
jgi:hypothetical protein